MFMILLVQSKVLSFKKELNSTLSDPESKLYYALGKQTLSQVLIQNRNETFISLIMADWGTLYIVHQTEATYQLPDNKKLLENIVKAAAILENSLSASVIFSIVLSLFNLYSD